MSLLPIVTLPDEKTLREVSRPVAVVDSDVKKLWDDMLETMYDAPGIGLAAIQVGVPQRLLVIDLAEGRRAEDAAVRRQPGDRLGERGAERL